MRNFRERERREEKRREEKVREEKGREEKIGREGGRTEKERRGEGRGEREKEDKRRIPVIRSSDQYKLVFHYLQTEFRLFLNKLLLN